MSGAAGSSMSRRKRDISDLYQPLEDECNPMTTESTEAELPFPNSCQTAYFNGFSMMVGTGDVVIALQLNGRPTLVLNTSYTVAKTLAESLAGAIDQLERKTKTTIMTTRDVADAITTEVDQSSP